MDGWIDLAFYGDFVVYVDIDTIIYHLTPLLLNHTVQKTLEEYIFHLFDIPSDQDDFSLAVAVGLHFVLRGWGWGCGCGCGLGRGRGRDVVEDFEYFAHGLDDFGGVVCERETGFQAVDFGGEGGECGGGWGGRGNARVPEESAQPGVEVGEAGGREGWRGEG